MVSMVLGGAVGRPLLNFWLGYRLIFSGGGGGFNGAGIPGDRSRFFFPPGALLTKIILFCSQDHLCSETHPKIGSVMTASLRFRTRNSVKTFPNVRRKSAAC